MKDYYKILGVSKNTDEQEIKKVYRTLALKYHPDRNSDPDAEKRFKEITEAYGVLIDRAKRREYDLYEQKSHQAGYSEDFKYTQEEIIRDMFKNVYAAGIFKDLERSSGVRFDNRFLNQFFGVRSGFVFGGIFVGGFFPLHTFANLMGNIIKGSLESDAGSYINKRKSISHGGKKGLLKKWGLMLKNGISRQDASSVQVRGKDIYYDLEILSGLAKNGGNIKISIPMDKEREIVRVKIPEGIKDGTKLRLKGKGIKRWRDKAKGDLYLVVSIKDR